jgi:hypothetical protein
MTQPFNPTDRLTVTLEAQQWNQVLAALGEGPFRVVNPIIQALHDQIYAQQSEYEQLCAKQAEPIQRSDNVLSMEATSHER